MYINIICVHMYIYMYLYACTYIYEYMCIHKFVGRDTHTRGGSCLYI